MCLMTHAVPSGRSICPEALRYRASYSHGEPPGTSCNRKAPQGLVGFSLDLQGFASLLRALPCKDLKGVAGLQRHYGGKEET